MVGKKAEKRRKQEQNEATESVARSFGVGRCREEAGDARERDRDWIKSEKRNRGLKRNEKDGWMLEEGVETEKRGTVEYRDVGNEQEKDARKRRGERVPAMVGEENKKRQKKI